MSSSWAMSPARDLGPIEKEPITDWDLLEEPPSFQPELVSDPEVRAKVRSSGYGSSKVTVTRIELEDDELRPWHKEPTFKPKLVSDKSIRKAAQASGYGKKVPEKKTKKAPRPDFKPKPVRSSTGRKLIKETQSSGYGKVAALPPRPKTAPSLRFRPKINKKAAFKGTNSSGYGKIAAESPAVRRPQSSLGTRSNHAFVARYSLAGDRSHQQSREAHPREKGFRLDCHAVAAKPVHADSFPTPPPVPVTETSQKLKELAIGSELTSRVYEPAPLPERKEQPKPFRFGDANRALQYASEDQPQKTALADQVRSSKYGKELPPGAQAERPDEKVSEPVWNMTYKADIPAELPEAPRNKLTDQVGSHSYGHASPDVAELLLPEPEPVWLPSSAKPGIPEPAPVSRSALANVSTSAQASGARVMLRGQGEYDAEGYPDEGEPAEY
eukprot:UC1_evm1s1977